MKVLVIGATGKIGRLVMDALNNNDIEIYAPMSTIVNLRDIESIRKYLEALFFDYVFYCAIDKEKSDLVNRNLNNIQNLLTFEKHFCRFVYMSSRAVYDGLQSYHYIEPISIYHLPMPVNNPYSILKYKEELLLNNKIEAKSIILRLFDISYSITFHDIEERWQEQICRKGYCRNEILSPIQATEVKSVIAHIAKGYVNVGTYNLCGISTIDSSKYHNGEMLERTGKMSFLYNNKL